MEPEFWSSWTSECYSIDIWHTDRLTFRNFGKAKFRLKMVTVYTFTWQLFLNKDVSLIKIEQIMISKWSMHFNIIDIWLQLLYKVWLNKYLKLHRFTTFIGPNSNKCMIIAINTFVQIWKIYTNVNTVYHLPQEVSYTAL